MSQPIVFYDIASTPGTTWSPNTWKIKLVLNYKKLSYETVCLEFPDIEPTCKSIGAAPTSVRADGSPLYTLPTIYDPNTNTVVSDSAKIVRYLDEAYSDSPRLIPAGTSALHAAFDAAFMSLILPAFYPLLLSATLGILNPISAQYVRNQLAAQGGKSHEVSDAAQEGYWRALEESLGKVRTWMSLDRTSQPFFGGDRVSYADVTITAYLLWAKAVLGADHEDWARIAGILDGRWTELSGL